MNKHMVGILALTISLAAAGCGDTEDGTGGSGGTGGTAGSGGNGGTAGSGGEGGMGGAPVADCGALDDPAEGSVSSPDGTMEGAIATYACDERFNIEGESTRTCQGDGTWSGDAPTCSACVSDTLTLTAVQSISVQYGPDSTESTYNDNNNRAYSNPTGTCGTASPCDIVGWFGFDTSQIPDSAILDGMQLYAYTTTVQVTQPQVQIQYSNANDWERGSVGLGDIPRTNPNVSVAVTGMVPGDAGSFKMFEIDLDSQDFTADLADGWLTLGVDNTELEYSYAYFEGATGDNPGYLEVEICE